jgi:hypothetical protein
MHPCFSANVIDQYKAASGEAQTQMKTIRSPFCQSLEFDDDFGSVIRIFSQIGSQKQCAWHGKQTKDVTFGPRVSCNCGQLVREMA